MRDLSEGLNDLAGDVEIVDLRDRSIRHSRKLRARRVAVAMGGALCLVAALLVGGGALWSGRDKPRGGIDSAQDTAQGTGYYLKHEPDGAYAIYSWSEGADPVRVLSGGESFGGSVSVSPDGKYAAYYDATEMVVTDLADQGRVTTVQGVGDTCMEPAWSPDSMSVLLSTATSARMVDVGGETSFVSEVPRPEGCHARLVQYADGYAGYVAVSAEGDEITYTDRDDGGQFAAPAPVTGQDAAVPVSVNVDGSLMCMSSGVRQSTAEFGTRRLTCDYIATRDGVDTVVSLPVEGAVLLGAVFTVAESGTEEASAVPYDATAEPDTSDVTVTGPPETEVALRMVVAGKTVIVHAGLSAIRDEDGAVTDLMGFNAKRTLREPEFLIGTALLAYVP